MSSDKLVSLTNRDSWAAPDGIAFPDLVLLVPIVGIALSEGLLLFGFSAAAQLGHGVTVVFAAFVPTWLDETTDVFGALALVSVLRLVTLGMPVFVELTLFWLPLAYLPLLPGLYLLSRSHERIDVSFDPVTGLKLVPLVVPLGYVFAVVEFQFIEPASLLPAEASTVILGWFVLTMVAVSLVEEYLFRGVLQRALSPRFGWLPGILLASLTFALTRSGYGLGPGIVVSLVIGIVLGVLYDLSDSLTACALAHGSLNVVLFGLLPAFGGPFP